jgi:hypothetical protein
MRNPHTVTLLNVNRRRRTSSLLFAATLLAFGFAACGSGDASKPDLPTSVSPGWSLKKMDSSQPPAALPKTSTPPICWTADYASEGSAAVQICGYRSKESAFEAVQELPPAANQVQIPKGVYLVIVRWNNVSQAGITALVTAVQKTLPDK